MAYGRNFYGSGIYAAYPLDVVTDLAGTSTATATTQAEMVVDQPLDATVTATATSTANIAMVLALSGTADFTFVATGNIRQIIPPTPAPSGTSPAQILRVSPVMPDPVLDEGKPT